MQKKYTVSEAVEILGLCRARVVTKIKEGHFPHAHKCECGLSYLLTAEDINNDLKQVDRRYKPRKK